MADHKEFIRQAAEEQKELAEALKGHPLAGLFTAAFLDLKIAEAEEAFNATKEN